MTFDTNASIRFLMKEMDPSESLLFERELERNPDLLIELETLKNTLARLDGAPMSPAPDGVLADVRRLASIAATSRRRHRARTRFLQAAAVLTLAALPAVFFASRTWISPSGTGIAGGNAAADPSSPWVDRNETLRLSSTTGATASHGATAAPGSAATASSASAAVDSLHEASLRKLRPLTGEGATSTRPARVQLARSTQR